VMQITQRCEGNAPAACFPPAIIAQDQTRFLAGL